MEKKLEVNVGAVLTPIEIKDADGTTLGTAKINLFDIRLVARIREIAEFFRTYKIDGTDPAAVAKLDEILLEKFCFMLGYDCRDSLFRVLSPTTILPNGEMFAMEIVSEITKRFTDDVKERAAARAQLIAQYTKKHRT